MFAFTIKFDLADARRRFAIPASASDGELLDHAIESLKQQRAAIDSPLSLSRNGASTVLVTASDAPMTAERRRELLAMSGVHEDGRKAGESWQDAQRSARGLSKQPV